MTRPIVKYLDPVSGEYEFATVVDIGDLRNLNTTIKSDIVGAINSIISDGVHNPINNEKIEDLERILESIKDGTFDIEDFGSIDEYLKQQFLDELDKINEKNREEIQSVLTQLDTSVDDAIKDYQEKVAAQNIILENAENTLADARDTLEAKAAELETTNIGLSELETEFNELDSYISTNVRTIDFDNFNAMVEDYESVVTQTSDEVGVDMSGSTLSYLTGRVTDAEANISLQADEISSKMGYDEFQYMPVPKYDYGENLLFDTFDFGDAWNGKNGAQVTPDTFLFGKVVAFNSPTGLYETRTDDLTIGESYVFSTYVNVQPSSKEPSEVRYEPVSSSYDPTDFKIQIGGKSFNPGVYEDLSGINGWVRINQEFVADTVNPIISITPTGVNSQSEVAYMAMPKVEKGLTVTPWQPHIEDKYATMSSTQSMMKQQANSITAFVTGVEELDESYKQATSTFQMLADGFAANTEAVEVFEDTVERYGTEYSNINGKFEQKVWKDDFEGIIEDINIDNRNRVLNSDFIRNEISDEDRRLIVEDWSLNSDWEIKTIDDNKYLSRNRTGLTQNLITSASSNYFPVRDKERVLFGFDLIHSGLDNDKVFAIELFDISDKRLLKEEFSLSSLAKVGNRYHGSFNISTPGVQKGKVVLQLPKNGSVSFTKISFQNADIGSIDWSPAPEDSWIIQSKLESYISQVEDEVTIGGVGRKLNTLTGLLTEDKGTFTLNPDKIATEVFSSETYDDMGFVNKTNFEQTADGWIQEITDKGRLAGYINASPDTYRISFDKIMLEGTTWADRLGSSKIMVTENFALIGKNGTPVLDVNNDGSINMNVTSLKVGPYNALTTGDKESIKQDVTESVIETTEPYIHIAYADTEDGAGLSFDPSGKEYIGITKSSSPISSQIPSDYTWSKWMGRDGSNGIPGPKGNDGRTQYLHIAYANSADGISGFDTEDSANKLYIGTYTDFYEPDSQDPSKYSWTLIKGDKGERGATGSRGPQGYDGTGISAVTEHYLVSNQSTGVTYSTSGWGTSVPTMTPELRFLWNYEEIHFTDGTSEPTLPVVVGVYGQQGPKGSEGEDGRSIEKIEERYLATSIESGVTRSTSGWTEKMQVTTPTEKFLWNYEIITWTKAPLKTYVEPIIIGVHGDKGEQGPRGLQGLEGPEGKQGIEGKKGADGKSSYTHIAYATGDQGQTFSHDTFPQATHIGMYVSDNQNSSDNWRDYKWTLIKGKDGARGLEGPKGEDGRTPYFHTAWANSADGKSGFSTTVSTGKLYLGTVTTFEPGDPTDYTKYTWTLIKGEKGDTGKDGVAGKDGVGIQKTEIHYASSASGTTRPSTGWNLAVPSTSPGNYLWTRTTWTYTDGDKEEGYSVSRIGKDGNTGKDGVAGKDGVGIKSTVINYAASSSGTTKPASGWTSTVPSVTPGNYLWTRTVWTYTDNDVETGYSVSRIGKDGPQGPQGPQGIRGPAGSNGQSQYVHIRYSANSNGSGMDTKPSSTTKYVGIAVTNSATAPPYTGFTWSKYVGDEGAEGPQGIKGDKGDDGVTTYTWVRYADTPTSGMDNFPEGKKYIGLAFNKTTQTESNNYSDYQWSLMPQNIEIGGRNLIGFFNVTERLWINTNGSTSVINNAFTSDYIDVAGYKFITATQKYLQLTTVGSFSLYDENKTFITRADGNGKILTIEIPSDVKFVRYSGKQPDGKYEEGIKVEKGNTATDWTPAPEDIEAAYTAVAQAKAEAERVKAESYADGIVSDEEKARIADADAKLAAAKKHAENISKVQDIGNGDKKFINVGSMATKPSSATGYLVIKTPLTSPYMTKMKISGYNYRTSKTNIDISVSFYAYYNNAFHNYSFISSGNYSYSKVQLARDSSGKTVVIIGNQSDTYSYPKISIDEVLVTQGTPPESFKDGFSAEIVTDISMYTNVVDVPGDDTQSQINKSVKSTDVEYYLSTSSTGLAGGSWQTTAPAWVNGRYMWSRTKVVLNDGTTSYNPSSTGTNITGAKGSTGSTGAAGKGVSSITEEYYLSNSKTSRVGGSWTTTAPTWSTGKYMWTRSKIVWVNPSSTTYTDPIVDTAWEAVNEIEIGGTNLLQNSRTVSISSNNNATYPASVTAMEENGRKFSRVRRTNLTLQPTTFSIYSTIPITNINKSIFENDFTVVSFKARASQDVTMSMMQATYGGSPIVSGNLGNINITTEWKTFYSVFAKIPKAADGLRVNPLNTITSVNMSTFYLDVCEWKIEKGNKPTDWSPAPEDTQSQIDEKANQSDTEARLNEIASDLLVKQQEIEAAATAGELDAFVKKYNQEQEAYAKEKKASEEALASAEDAIDLITNKMDNMAETWEFFDEYIKFDKGSIVLGNETEGSHVRIHNDRISFYSNGYEVAAITQGRMTIEAGTFVEEIQISEFKFQKSSNGHLTVRYVG